MKSKTIAIPLAVAVLLGTSIGCLLLVAVVVLATGGGTSFRESVASRFGPTPTVAPVRTMRPTYTPTPNWTATPTPTATPTNTLIPTTTPVPTETPVPTDTPIPPDTVTPVPTDTPVPPPPKPPTETPTPGPPTATPVPDYPFRVVEQNDPTLTKTNNTAIVVFVAVIDGNGTPLGGYRMIGDSPQVEFNNHVESLESCWDWCTHTGEGGYAKVANLKFEPGAFIDGTWNVYLVDGGGGQVSPVVPLTYGTDPNQWRWDFISFQQK